MFLVMGTEWKWNDAMGDAPRNPMGFLISKVVPTAERGTNATPYVQVFLRFGTGIVVDGD